VGDQLRTGACRCGRVRFEVGGKPVLTMACHCTGCQRMTSSAFSLSAMYPVDQLRVVAGETVIGGLHGADLQHHFCGHCMSWLFTRFPAAAGRPDVVNVRATMLDGARDFRPFIECCTKEMLPWVKTPAVHSFEAFPLPSEYPALLAEFVAVSG